MNTKDILMVWGETQQNHDFLLSANDRARGKLEVPANGTTVASVSIYEFGSAPFKASVLMTKDPDDFDGIYGPVSRTFHLQVGGTQKDGTNDVVVLPGETWYFNVTLAHDGKAGGGGNTYTAAMQLRS